MDTETREAFTTVHGRVDKTNEGVLKLTEQVSRVVSVIETEAAAKASKKPGMSFMAQQWIRAGFQLGMWGLLGLVVYFWTHSMHGHVPQ